MEIKLCLSVLFVLIDFLAAFKSSKIAEGYANGYLPVCPGVTKPAKILTRSLRHLSLVHLTYGSQEVTNQTTYNYFNMKLLSQKLDFRRKTAIFMFSYLDSLRFRPLSVLALRTTYVQRGYNVLMVDDIHFTTTLYFKAARIIRSVGKRTAEMLRELTRYGLDPKKVQLIGFNLGGQGTSFVGKHYRELTGRNISRITALDPAGPCFRRLGPGHRIDASDADQVDVIHTNSDGYGFAGAVGHVDFYVNGGEYQVSGNADAPCIMICSHIRSALTWLASVLHPDKFVAVKCDSVQDARDRNCFDRPLVTNLLGPKTDFSKPGIYNIQTLNKFPYFLGDKGISKDFNFYEEYLSRLNKDDVFVV